MSETGFTWYEHCFAWCENCGWIARGAIADLEPEAGDHEAEEGHSVKIDL